MYDIDAYHNLANAIVVAGARDYKKSLILHRKYPDDEKLKKAVLKDEQFFYSGWYQMLTDIDGDYIVRNIRKLVEEEERKKEEIKNAYQLELLGQKKGSD